MSLPQNASDFTAEWINAAVADSTGWRARHVKVVNSDMPGQTSEVARLEVTWEDENCPLPQHLVAKYTSRNRQVIESVINLYQQYWRETSFYREIPDVGINRPDCFYAHHEPDTQEFVLLMADLSPATSPSWASTPAQVAEAVSHLPAFHARWWNSDELRGKDWLVQFDNRDFYRLAAGAAAACIPAVRELFGEEVEDTLALMALYHEKIEQVLDHLPTRPFTLVHGDYHPKQMFFPTEAGGEFSVIDWQFSFLAQGAWDLARIVLTGQPVEDRRASERRLLDDYLQGLKQNGVGDYTMAQLEADYRLGILVNQMIMVIATGDTDITLVERECKALGVDFKDVLLKRGEAAVRDWDVTAYLRSI